MSRALLHVAALALPLVGLGGLWLTTDRASRAGSEWDVPIQGYDPRDLLQGHYVQFQYDWPLRPTKTDDEPRTPYADLCLTGVSPIVQQVWVKIDDNCPSRVRASDAQQGRLYASQVEALRLQDKLADRKLQGMVRIRLRPDGHITPLRITFRPRPPEPQAGP